MYAVIPFPIIILVYYDKTGVVVNTEIPFGLCSVPAKFQRLAMQEMLLVCNNAFWTV